MHKGKVDMMNTTQTPWYQHGLVHKSITAGEEANVGAIEVGREREVT